MSDILNRDREEHDQCVTELDLYHIRDDIRSVREDMKSYLIMSNTLTEGNNKRNEFVDLLIAREVKRDKFKDAIIEKTIAGLIWAFLVFVGVAIVAYVKTSLVK